MARLPAAQRRTQLVDAAIRVMTREGIAAATTRSISAEADVSPSVFHYCFDSKQHLFSSVIEVINQRTLDDALAAQVSVLDQRESDLHALVSESLLSYWRHVVDHPDQHRLTYEITLFAMQNPDYIPLATLQYTQYSRLIEAVLDRMVEATGAQVLTPVPVLARYLASLIDGLTLNYLVLGDDAQAREVLELAGEHVLRFVR